MRKFLVYGSVVVLLMLVSAAAVWAYFTYLKRLPEQAYSTGSLLLDVMLEASPAHTNWLPGESRQIEWTLRNTGTLPMHVKGKLEGGFSGAGLDPAMIQLTKLERQAGDGWTEIPVNDRSTPSEFFYSQSGDEQSLILLGAGENRRIRVTFTLSEQADNAYQKQPFTVQLQVAAKQTTQGATWPAWE